jgi:hypothetical protein
LTHQKADQVSTERDGDGFVLAEEPDHIEELLDGWLALTHSTSHKYLAAHGVDPNHDAWIGLFHSENECSAVGALEELVPNHLSGFLDNIPTYNAFISVLQRGKSGGIWSDEPDEDDIWFDHDLNRRQIGARPIGQLELVEIVT